MAITSSLRTALLRSVRPASRAGAGAAESAAASEGRRLVRAEGRPPAQVEYEQSLVAFFVEGAQMLGIPKSVAAIYGICFASAEPLSFSDINERLDISSGSISQGLRVLKEVGALKPEAGSLRPEAGGLKPEAGSRRPEAGSLRAEAGSQKPEAGNQMSDVGRQPVLRSLGEGGMSASSAAQTNNSERIANNPFPADNPAASGGAANAAQPNAYSLPPNAGSAAKGGARYTPDLELRNLVLRWIDQRLQKQLETGRSRIRTLRASVPADAHREVLDERLRALEIWHGKAAALLPLVKTALKIG
ncbi:hypothetical protein [Opitutus sp. ER46]|uniref:hypothetical protein n=1 Tax=Opitutus sp. ER46 TaxID=2161864 RepID=UPI000D2F7118|nr:hypothetical protein [Opitutus sp. ER46]PTX98387.1 hypothetical protein DB354_03720 [Opitutus sp. ER46]